MCQSCLSRRRFLRLGAAGVATTGVAGCDRLPSFVSDAQAAAMGERTWDQIRENSRPSGNAEYQEALRSVSARLLTAGGHAPGDWEVEVFARPDANAFALPGGKIGVFEGMFDVIGNIDQLAAIVGHEIGHVEAEHGQERMSAQIAREAGLRVVLFFLNMGDVEFAGEIVAALGLGTEVGLLLPFSRRQELEADRLGLTAMARADYDPSQAVDLWRRMEAAGSGQGPEFISTHPAPDARIDAIREMLPELT